MNRVSLAIEALGGNSWWDKKGLHIRLPKRFKSKDPLAPYASTLDAFRNE